MSKGAKEEKFKGAKEGKSVDTKEEKSKDVKGKNPDPTEHESWEDWGAFEEKLRTDAVFIFMPAFAPEEFRKMEALFFGGFPDHPKPKLTPLSIVPSSANPDDDATVRPTNLTPKASPEKNVSDNKSFLLGDNAPKQKDVLEGLADYFKSKPTPPSGESSAASPYLNAAIRPTHLTPRASPEYKKPKETMEYKPVGAKSAESPPKGASDSPKRTLSDIKRKEVPGAMQSQKKPVLGERGKAGSPKAEAAVESEKRHNLREHSGSPKEQSAKQPQKKFKDVEADSPDDQAAKGRKPDNDIKGKSPGQTSKKHNLSDDHKVKSAREAPMGHSLADHSIAKSPSSKPVEEQLVHDAEAAVSALEKEAVKFSDKAKEFEKEIKKKLAPPTGHRLADDATIKPSRSAPAQHHLADDAVVKSPSAKPVEELLKEAEAVVSAFEKEAEEFKDKAKEFIDKEAKTQAAAKGHKLADDPTIKASRSAPVQHHLTDDMVVKSPSKPIKDASVDEAAASSENEIGKVKDKVKAFEKKAKKQEGSKEHKLSEDVTVKTPVEDRAQAAMALVVNEAMEVKDAIKKAKEHSLADDVIVKSTDKKSAEEKILKDVADKAEAVVSAIEEDAKEFKDEVRKLMGAQGHSLEDDVKVKTPSHEPREHRLSADETATVKYKPRKSTSSRDLSDLNDEVPAQFQTAVSEPLFGPAHSSGEKGEQKLAEQKPKTENKNEDKSPAQSKSVLRRIFGSSEAAAKPDASEDGAEQTDTAKEPKSKFQGKHKKEKSGSKDKSKAKEESKSEDKKSKLPTSFVISPD